MRIRGNGIDLRLVEVEDAPFILRLRLDERLKKYISSTSNDFELQVDWIRKYKEREKQGQEYYFIVEGKDGLPYGTLRLYDFQNDSFCWGSWIMLPDHPEKAIESAVLAYRCGFEELGFSKSHFNVDKENARVVAFHKRFGAEVVGENEKEFCFHFTKDRFDAAKKKYRNLWK